MYSNNDIKAAETWGGFSVLQLISLPIVYTTDYFSGDIRLELYVTISDMSVVQAPSHNALSILISNSKVKEEIFQSNFPLSDVQDFLAGYQNSMNKDE